jgi:hypothetical protein
MLPKEIRNGYYWKKEKGKQKEMPIREQSSPAQQSEASS